VRVSVVMTAAATQFVTPRTFEALSGRPVVTELFAPVAKSETPFAHLATAKDGEVFCIAPATANILAKAAHGLADDLVSTLCLSFSGPILFAPGMNCEMWDKSAVQRNVKLLRMDGRRIVGPEEGRLACGDCGMGRMAAVETIFSVIAEELGKSGVKKMER
jgi:Phosphopantothenoylcysteine synthetase/decarboxylase